ncbi:MAG: hypothetical protein E7363_03490 [Clostridiales bacterium]|nr:hypothetical protein [Clostridiales bacterium]
MKRIENLRVPVGANLSAAVAKKLRIPQSELGELRLLRRSLDARKKDDIAYVVTLEAYRKGERMIEEPTPTPLPLRKDLPPVGIVGAGPCGLFAALTLLYAGIPVTVFERGESVTDRQKAVEGFYRTGALNTQSNIQFGEGGAGTFSDGKLNTQTHSPYVKQVLKTFVRHGAPKEILWENKPHVGSDNLPRVVENMRKEILSLGGSVLFSTPITDLRTVKGGVTAYSGEKSYPVSALILAIGHSARDTFSTLLNRGFAMEQKPFAVGMRVEHLQSAIQKAQYGKMGEKLPPADYKLTAHALEKGIYSFCMCPGGVVVAAASEENALAVNGMSNYLRNGKNANSAIVVQVNEKDFGSGVLAGVNYQRELERHAFRLGGGNYAAPVCRMQEFLQGKTSSTFGEVLPTYPLKTQFANPVTLLGEPLFNAMRHGLTQMNERLSGFTHPDAILTGVETRTSSPIRILRGENLQSLSHPLVFPAGEGAGYAGGIVSAGVDGIRVAQNVAKALLN